MACTPKVIRKRIKRMMIQAKRMASEKSYRRKIKRIIYRQFMRAKDYEPRNDKKTYDAFQEKLASAVGIPAKYLF